MPSPQLSYLARFCSDRGGGGNEGMVARFGVTSVHY